ncbi:MAG TPA: flagellar basal-body rod protein FlgF [Blastocatellia bacterium]|nr:flagellar basal-body rod protein FlgF [Blastocatellia bacterium]
MNYGLYTAYLGMRARMRTIDVIANNIANSSTSGFKAGGMVYHSVETDAAGILPAWAQPYGQPAADAQAGTPLTPSRALGVVTGGLTDFSTGSIRQTGNPLDVALSGDGFLVVQTARGERYTRSGSLTLDATGQLVTMQGDLVVGDGGPITIRPGEVSIGEDGSVSVGGQIAGRLKLVRFENPQAELVKEGDSLFAAISTDPPAESTQTRVLQGALESSNVNPVEQMVSMMQNNREFESLQRSVTQLMTLRKIASEIGKI